MKQVYFRYKSHPSDFFRDEKIHALPNPDSNLESFLIWFLKSYQSDIRVSHIDDLYKLMYNEFADESDQTIFREKIGNKTQAELVSEITCLENELRMEAYRNFYHLLFSNQIELIADEEK